MSIIFHSIPMLWVDLGAIWLIGCIAECFPRASAKIVGTLLFTAFMIALVMFAKMVR